MAENKAGKYETDKERTKMEKRVEDCFEQIRNEDICVYRNVMQRINDIWKNDGESTESCAKPSKPCVKPAEFSRDSKESRMLILKAGAKARMTLPAAIGSLASIVLSTAAVIIVLAFAGYSIFISNSQNQTYNALIMCIVLVIPFLMIAVILYVVIHAVCMLNKYQRNADVYSQIVEICENHDRCNETGKKEIYGKPNRTNRRFIYKCQIVQRSDKRFTTEK